MADPFDPKTLPRREEGVVFMYSLSDPDSGEVRYIGKAVSPRDRFRQHVRETGRGRPTHAKMWVRSLLADGRLPVMSIIERTDADSWERRERALIAAYSLACHKLTNIAEGGNQPRSTLEGCRKAAAVVNSGPDVGLFNLVRTLRRAAVDATSAGSYERARRYQSAAEAVRLSKGHKRDAMRALAARKGMAK